MLGAPAELNYSTPRRRGGSRDSSPLTARVVLRMQFLQTLAGDVSVDLSRRQVAVPEKHLHHAQIRAVVQQMGRKGMPQGMRRELFLDAGLFGIPLDDVPERLARHAVAAARGKQIVRLPLQ